MSLELQGHTFDISHTISLKEVQRICRLYGIKSGSNIHIEEPFISGINELVIDRNPVIKDGIKIKDTYVLKIKVNAGRLLNISSVSMIEFSQKNVQKMNLVLNGILSKRLQLDNGNCDSKNWTLNRLDCGIDLKINYSNLCEMSFRIRLLHQSLNLFNNRKCKITRFKGYDCDNVKYESLVFNNDNYKYNIYLKYKQMIKERKGLVSKNEFEEIDGVMRIEKQIYGKGVSNCVGSPQRLSLLLDGEVRCRIIKSIVSEMKIFFGEGMHVTYEQAMAKIIKSRYSDMVKHELMILYTGSHKFGFQNILEILLETAKSQGVEKSELVKLKKNIIQKRKKIEVLGISIVGITSEEAEYMGVGSLKNINTLINQATIEKSSKRQKSKFAKVYYVEKEGRYKCNPSIRDARGNVSRSQLTDKDENKLKDKVLALLINTCKENLYAVKGNKLLQQQVLKQTIKDLIGFLSTIERPLLREEIQEWIDRLEIYLAKEEAYETIKRN